MYGKGPRTTIHKAATRITLPNNPEREKRIDYLEQYSCKPPPLFLLLLSCSQIGVFVYHVVILTNEGRSVGTEGPAYVKGPFIFNPNKKIEVWRYLTYMFVHSGYFHIIFNVLIQLGLGVPLEMVHRWWRIMPIYLTGVIAGSLSVAIADPNIYLAGASGGVYALITAHLANVIFNWSEMEIPALRLFSFLMLAGFDIGVAVYYRYMGQETKTSYTGHLAGAVVGLLLGIIILRNLRIYTWERVLWWCCLVVFLGLLIGAIVWNAVLII